MASVVPISSLDDPRVAEYVSLKERDLSREGDRFIAEGELVVRRLLASDHPVHSLLVAEHKVERMLPLVRSGSLIFTASRELVSRIVGFPFHSGVMAVGQRKPPLSMAELARGWPVGGVDRAPVTLMVLPRIANTDNLGALLRVAAAFGADVLLGPACCDPFYRQAARVSMGACFTLRMARSTDLARDLNELRREHGVETIGAVLAEDAEPLPRANRPRRAAILLGNETEGLSQEELRLCDRRVTLPMCMGTDSLNVATAAAVFLYHFTHVAR